jgi:1-acyl-sn-glycerol-3-phosphate acyltransferase
MRLQKVLGFLLLLLPAIIFFFNVLPLIAVFSWFVGRAIIRCCNMPDKDLPEWLETPWDLLTNLAVRLFCLRVRDSDGQNSFLIPGIRTTRCAVLANHRSWGDFFIDPTMAHCPPVARRAAVAATGVSGLVGLLCNKVVMINRDKDSRQTIAAKCDKHDRFLLYPEGTRRAAQENCDEVAPLKAGGIKNLYETKRPVLVVITVNKEYVVNEKAGFVRFGVTLYRARSNLIEPADYTTFEAFLEAVESAWKDTWSRAYALRTLEVPATNSTRQLW